MDMHVKVMRSRNWETNNISNHSTFCWMLSEASFAVITSIQWNTNGYQYEATFRHTDIHISLHCMLLIAMFLEYLQLVFNNKIGSNNGLLLFHRRLLLHHVAWNEISITYLSAIAAISTTITYLLIHNDDDD